MYMNTYIHTHRDWHPYFCKFPHIQWIPMNSHQYLQFGSSITELSLPFFPFSFVIPVSDGKKPGSHSPQAFTYSINPATGKHPTMSNTATVSCPGTPFSPQQKIWAWLQVSSPAVQMPFLPCHITSTPSPQPGCSPTAVPPLLRFHHFIQAMMSHFSYCLAHQASLAL